MSEVYVNKRSAMIAGSCMNCDGRHFVVLEFRIGGFVARLCTSCFRSLVRNAKMEKL